LWCFLAVDRTAVGALRAASARYQWRDGHQTRSPWLCPSRLLPLVDLLQKHRDAQSFTRGLAREELALALRQMSTLTAMLCVGVCKEAGSQEHGMLAIFLTQRIDTLVQVRQPLQPDDLAKQIELAVIRLRELIPFTLNFHAK
jgi:hypothetical protein